MADNQNFGPVTFIPGVNKGRYPHCHSIYLQKSGVLIDPASDRDKLKALRDHGGVNTVWLSHWHEDHIKDLDLFDDKPLWMHEKDAPPLSDLDVFADWYCQTEDQFSHIREKWRHFMIEQFHYKSRQPNRFLKGGEIVKLDDVTVEVLHTPGHSPGGLCFFFKEPEVLFIGDFDLTSFGPFYGDLYSDIDQTIESIQFLRTIPAKTWITSHEKGVYKEVPDELWDNFLSVIQRREDNLLEFLNQPRTLLDIAKSWFIYGKSRNLFDEEDMILIEQISMKKHLDRLIKKNIVKQEKDLYLMV